MPPCAHTECDRFTGTMEKRSTFAPISAILMTAESPARPPPITIILGTAIVGLPFFHILCRLILCGLILRRVSARSLIVHSSGRLPCCRPRLIGLLRARPERSQAGQSRAGQDKEKHHTHGEKPLLRLVSGNDSPLRREQPDAISEVP